MFSRRNVKKTTKPENDIITEQNRLSDLKKKARDLEGSVKRHLDDLKSIEKGDYSHWGAAEVARMKDYHTGEKTKLEAALVPVNEKIQVATALRPDVKSLPFNSVLKAFQGTDLDNAIFALELIALSQTNGFWIPGASRRCRAALNISKTAKKAMTPSGKLNFKYAMEPVEELMAKWDATRPPPVFTTMGLSPTVTATMKQFGAVKVEVCPMRFEKRERIDPKTKKTVYYTVAILLWPEGTVHGNSKYQGTHANSQCEACGHAIKAAYNWVPLVIWGADEKPQSLWTGHDCARNLFGIKLTGELELVEE